MPRTKGTRASGYTLGYGDDDVATPTPIAELLNSNLPEIAVAEDIDDTSSDDADTDYEYFVPGRKIVNEFDVNLKYVKSQVATIIGILGVEKYFTITYKDGSTLGGYGYLKSLGGTLDLATTIKHMFRIKPSGPWDWTPAS